MKKAILMLNVLLLSSASAFAGGVDKGICNSTGETLLESLHVKDSGFESLKVSGSILSVKCIGGTNGDTTHQVVIIDIEDPSKRAINELEITISYVDENGLPTSENTRAKSRNNTFTFGSTLSHGTLNALLTGNKIRVQASAVSGFVRANALLIFPTKCE